jgi:hypothetical protein
MARHRIAAIGLSVGLCLLLGGSGAVIAQSVAPPGGDYRKVSELTALPDFIPGLGTLYVEPTRMPVGPYVAYDRQGHLVSTIYMIPLPDIEAHKKIEAPEIAQGMPVDHVDMVYNAGHAGMPEPHYHMILWYIPKAEADALK